MANEQLNPEDLVKSCSLRALGFKSTRELEPLTGIVGQERATNAISFAVGMNRDGYNAFLLGPSGVGKHTFAREHLQKIAQQQPSPPDLCYVHNFHDPQKPKILSLPAGEGSRLRGKVTQLIEDLQTAIPSLFESERYRQQVEALHQEFAARQEDEMEKIRDEAKAENVSLLQTPSGLIFAPLHEGQVIKPEEFQRLPEANRQRIEESLSKLEQRLNAFFRRVPLWEKEHREKIKELNRALVSVLVQGLMEPLRDVFQSNPEVQAYLQQCQFDIIENAVEFVQFSRGQTSSAHGGLESLLRSPFRKYLVNVIVDNSGQKGAPVIYENHPTLQNLVGRIEHISQMGTLSTDFALIKGGACHRANGGYLILDAVKLLTQPFAWEALKRMIQSRQLRIESPAQTYGLISTVSLEPEPVPSNLKILLVGERNVYYLLADLDPEFSELFKISADFDDSLPRTPENIKLYARIMATIVKKEALLPLDAAAVATVVEYGSRIVEDQEKLSSRIRVVADLLREADYLARQKSAQQMNRAHIRQALSLQQQRAGRVSERIREETLRNSVLISTSGKSIGQVNALTVMELGGFRFGAPTRITARARMGDGDVVDIEKEVEMAGSIHSKGVMILSSYLRTRYCESRQFSLYASLVFEQSYGLIEGDSAAMGELCALLSAIGGVPILQNLAITGSVNQHGQAQSIGGVNEKIEGFYELCRARGLTGDQGVLIPAANRKNLMLETSLVDSVKKGDFFIYTYENVDDALTLLTGMKAGGRGTNGKFPPQTVNRVVEDRLLSFASKREGKKLIAIQHGKNIRKRL